MRYTLIAELTHRRRPNPVELAHGELPAPVWQRAIDDADALGVVQLHLTGGEPLLYRELEALVARGRAHEMSVHLITSGVPLTRERFAALCDAGLDHVQLSFEDAIAGTSVFDRKLQVAMWVKAAGLAFTIHVVLDRGNIDRISEHVALAQWLGADRLELASAADLVPPTRDQIDRAFETAARARERLLGAMAIVFVKPDTGWARRNIHIAPTGRVRATSGVQLDSIADRPLGEIWEIIGRSSREIPGSR